MLGSGFFYQREHPSSQSLLERKLCFVFKPKWNAARVSPEFPCPQCLSLQPPALPGQWARPWPPTPSARSLQAPPRCVVSFKQKAAFSPFTAKRPAWGPSGGEATGELAR